MVTTKSVFPIPEEGGKEEGKRDKYRTGLSFPLVKAMKVEDRDRILKEVLENMGIWEQSNLCLTGMPLPPVPRRVEMVEGGVRARKKMRQVMSFPKPRGGPEGESQRGKHRG